MNAFGSAVSLQSKRGFQNDTGSVCTLLPAWGFMPPYWAVSPFSEILWEFSPLE